MSNQDPISYLTRALYIREQALGPGHPSTALSLHNLASLYRIQKRYAEAGVLYQRALRIREQALGLGHPDTAQTIYGLAMLCQEQSNDEEARTWYTRALVIYEQAFGTHHPEATQIRKNLIALLHVLGQQAEAAQLETIQTEQETSKEKQEAHPED